MEIDEKIFEFIWFKARTFEYKLEIATYNSKYWYVGIDKFSWKQKYFKKLIEYEKKINSSNIFRVLGSYKKMDFILKIFGIDLKEIKIKSIIINEIMDIIRHINKCACIHDYFYNQFANIYNVWEINKIFKDDLMSYDFSKNKYVKKGNCIKIFRNLYIIVNLMVPIYWLMNWGRRKQNK